MSAVVTALQAGNEQDNLTDIYNYIFGLYDNEMLKNKPDEKLWVFY